MLVDFNLDLYNPRKKTPFSPIAYYPEENEFYHPWSLSRAYESYGYFKLNELIPITDYLNLPNVLVESLLINIPKGMSKRESEDVARANAKNRGKDDPNGLTRQQLEELRKAGVDVSNL